MVLDGIVVMRVDGCPVRHQRAAVFIISAARRHAALIDDLHRTANKKTVRMRLACALKQ